MHTEDDGTADDQEAALLEADMRDLKTTTSFLKQCNNAEKAVKQELDWGSLAPSCKSLLRENMDLNCMLPPL